MKYHTDKIWRFCHDVFFPTLEDRRPSHQRQGGHSMPFPCGLCDSSRIQEVAEHGPWRRPQGAGDASATDWVNESKGSKGQTRPLQKELVPCTKEFGCLMVCDKLWQTKARSWKLGHGDMGTGRQCQAVHSKPQLELLWLILNSKGKKCRFGFNS